MKQVSFSNAKIAGTKHITRREQFLADVEQVMPLASLETVIAPSYPTGKHGRPPIDLTKMLRLHRIKQ